ncbi:3-deoxy-manno-octulosonate cytidylyltransferase [Sphingomonas sp. LY29]|uniref:3-deoxy-manno-octulosonate cytidylyltransferase n=1 Tax=Sphingomonas sp. LY29 TaxID=3095341 RepID=UPI002D77CB9B|nr:3-deoxy-manno-octulosonate cytidylyltransferase [Sphingomonas sp. LY29]WRP25325.1 3-deoxy-manno-octulosonate cytidylyltransferase [Sphingomonas sp. LY29]
MPSPSFAIIIPARYESSRFPGKPLAPLAGASGLLKPLIQRSWECAREVEGASDRIWVATDDDRIAEVVEGFGGQVVMTSTSCRNGTERCAEAITALDLDVDIIVNLQGDAPLSPPVIVQDLVKRLADEADAAMATPAVRCSPTLYRHLEDDAANGRVGGTTVVFDRASRALYFSKRMIPYLPDRAASVDAIPVFLHLGMYAYRPHALVDYLAATPSTLEEVEGLEQLRFLDIGLPVSVMQMDPLGWDSIELNNPSDVGAIERILVERGIA